MSADLPFECPSCGDRFGFGDGAGFIGVFRNVPFHETPTPCCSAIITGSIDRDDWGEITMTITSWREDPS